MEGNPLEKTNNESENLELLEKERLSKIDLSGLVNDVVRFDLGAFANPLFNAIKGANPAEQFSDDERFENLENKYKNLLKDVGLKVEFIQRKIDEEDEQGLPETKIHILDKNQFNKYLASLSGETITRQQAESLCWIIKHLSEHFLQKTYNLDDSSNNEMITLLSGYEAIVQEFIRINNDLQSRNIVRDDEDDMFSRENWDDESVGHQEPKEFDDIGYNIPPIATVPKDYYNGEEDLPPEESFSKFDFKDKVEYLQDQLKAIKGKYFKEYLLVLENDIVPFKYNYYPYRSNLSPSFFGENAKIEDLKDIWQKVINVINQVSQNPNAKDFAKMLVAESKQELEGAKKHTSQYLDKNPTKKDILIDRTRERIINDPVLFKLGMDYLYTLDEIGKDLEKIEEYLNK